jgi:hypothetical protein
MRGHRSITEARLNGYHPSNVWVILLNAEQPKKFDRFYDPEMMLQNGFMPEIHIYKGESILRLDLRCLTGLIVHLVADDTTNLEQAAKSLMKFKPAQLYACNGKKLIQHHHVENKA